jgi:hypothetical protein
MVTLAGCVPMRELQYAPSAEHSVGYGACGRIYVERVELLGKKHYLEMYYEEGDAKLIGFRVVVPLHTKVEWTAGEATVIRTEQGTTEKVQIGNIRVVSGTGEIELPLRVVEGDPRGDRADHSFGISFGDGRPPKEFDLLLPAVRINGTEVKVPPFHYRYRNKLQFLPLMC